MSLKNIAVLASGGGTDLQSVIDAVNSGMINAKIAVVISNRKNAYALRRAKQNGIPSIYICKKDYDTNEEFNDAIISELKKYDISLVVLAGYLAILTSDFVKSFKNKIINIHPSLIPSFCGAGFYGLKVHQAVIDYGAKVSGATVHFVDEGTDTGPIIIQRSVPVLQDDDAKTLQKRILEVEHKILPEAVKLFIDDKLEVKGRRVYIND